jgi:hypothetical protein
MMKIRDPDLEVWKLVPSLEGLLASSHGRLMVAPYQQPKTFRGAKQIGGVPTPGQWDGNRWIYIFRGKTYRSHRLVCEAFNGPSPIGHVCMHLDENSRNNYPWNLRWGTQKENLNAPGFLDYCKSRTGDDNPYVKGKLKKETVTD